MFNNTTNIFIETLASLQKLDDLERLINPNSAFFQSYRNSLAEVNLGCIEEDGERARREAGDRGGRAGEYIGSRLGAFNLPSLDCLPPMGNEHSGANGCGFNTSGALDRGRVGDTGGTHPLRPHNKENNATSVAERSDSSAEKISRSGFARLEALKHANDSKSQFSFQKNDAALVKPKATKNSQTSAPASKCTCSNSRCLKLYCACFAAGEVCGPQCQCKSCFNNEASGDIRAKMIEETLQKNPNAFTSKYKKHAQKGDVVHVYGCHCTKTGCIKEYCECFKIGTGCSRLCKCINCQNKKLDLQNEEVKDYYVKAIRKRRKTKFYEQQFGNSRKKSKGATAAEDDKRA